MKLDIIKCIITIAISALLSYACYEICNYDNLQWVITIGAFLTIGIPLIFSMAVSSVKERSEIMLKALSWITLITEVIANGIFVLFDFSIPFYVITNGLIILTFVMVYTSIYRTKL